MQYYEVVIILDNRRLIPSICLASSAKEAFCIVMGKEAIRKEMEGHQLVDFNVRGVTWRNDLREDQFLVQDSQDSEHWIITDIENNVVYKMRKKIDSQMRGVSLLSYLEEEPGTVNEDMHLKGRLLAWLAKFRPDLGKM